MSVYGDRDTGVQNQTTFPGKVFNPKAAVCPDHQLPTYPVDPRPQETSWSWGDWAAWERDKPLPEQQLLLSQEVKSQERLKWKSPLKLSKKQGMCPFGEGCGYVRTQFKGLDVFWSH